MLTVDNNQVIKVIHGDTIKVDVSNGVNVKNTGGITQRPSVLEFDSLADFPIGGTDGYIYIAKDTNLLYRWTGTAYEQVGGGDLSGYVPYTGATGDVDLGLNGLTVNDIKTKTLEFDTLYTPTGSEPIGSLFWNEVDGTVDIRLKNNATLQTGQELHFYGKASGNILNGELVQFAGVQGDHILIKKVVASEIINYPEYLVGVATQNINNGDFGYITWFGKVNGVYTNTPNNNDSQNWLAGDILYFDNTTGQLTKTNPTAPHRRIIVASVIKTQTGNSESGILLIRPTFGMKLTDLNDVNGTIPVEGSLLVNQGDDTFAFTSNIKDFVNVDVVREPTGFQDPENTIINYNSTNRTITLTGTIEAYYRGERIDVLTSGWVSDPHPTTLDKSYFLVYNGTTFQWLDLSSESIDFSYVLLAFVQYGTIDKYAIRETHGLMQWQSHRADHFTIGTYRRSGGDISGYTLSSTTASERRPLVSSCLVYDEDLPTTVNALTSEIYTQMYLTGSGTSTFAVDQTDIVPLSGNRPYYNQFTGGVWQQTLMSTNSYQSIWLVAVPTTEDSTSQKYRFLWVQGQSEGNLANEQAKQPQDLNLGQLTNLATEFVFIQKFIIRFVGGNWQIIQTDRLSGTRVLTTSSPSGAFLSSVSTDTTLTGDGTLANPLSVVSTGTIGGSIASGQVAFGGGTNTISGSNSFTWDNTNGRLGIGTTTPDRQLSIHTNGSAQFDLRGVFNSGFFNTFSFQRARGTLASPTLLQANDEIGGFAWGAWTGSYWTGSRAGIFGVADGNWTGGTNPVRLIFSTTTTESQLFERMRITSTGLIGINNTSPTAQLDITNALATQPVLRLTGVSGQSTDLVQVLNSVGGTLVAGISSVGTFVSNVDSGVFAGNASFTRANATAGAGATFFLQRYRGTIASPTAVLNGDTLGYFRANGWQNSAIRVGAQFDFQVDGVPSGSNLPTAIIFKSTNTGDATGLFDTLKIGALGTITIPKKSETGVRETLLKATVSDDSSSQFGISNGTNNNGWFLPTFYGFANYNTTNVISMKFTGYILAVKDVASDIATINFQTYITSSSTDPNNGTGSKIVNKPLVSVLNYLDKVLLISPDGSQAIGSNRTSLATAQLDVINALNTQPIAKFTGTTSNTLTINNDGSISPVSLADSSAPNNSIYYSTTQSKLVYKDSGGTVNNLY
jgi:hypothetical protein